MKVSHLLGNSVFYGKRKDLKSKGNKKLFFKSSCLTVKGQHVYRSKSKDKNNTSVVRTINLDPVPILNDKDFWKELEQMIILEKTS